MGTFVYDVMDTTLELLGPGTHTSLTQVEPGAHVTAEIVVPEGKVALVINALQGRDVVAFIGTPQQLRDSVVDGMCLPVPDGVDLVDAEHPRAHGFVVIDGGDQLPADVPMFLRDDE